MLWLSLFLPHLALEVFARAAADGVPLLIVDGKGTRRWVHACSRAAAQSGAQRGMALGAALSLLKEVRLKERDPAQEQAALETLAAWAGQFTPTIHILPQRGLLLETQASLELFGGLAPLQTQIQQGLEELGFHPLLGIAPTPEAAWLLSKVGDGRPITELGHLPERLAALPLIYLELAPSALRALKQMGVRRLEECLRLPRAGLAKRFEPALVDYLDRLLGRLPDPRPLYTPPASFASRLLLPAEVDNTEALAFAAHRLLLELAGFLNARGSGILQMELQLSHPKHAASRLSVGLVAPSRDAAHLGRLLRAKLDAFTLPAPVEAIALSAERLVPLTEAQNDLFAIRNPHDRFRLLERLQAYLGTEAVHGCQLRADHRPERAWQKCQPGEGGKSPSLRFGQRPLWLLEPPLPLNERDGQPQLNGALRLLSGPERIETGWWEEPPVQRDYFIAEDPGHARYWVFRNLADDEGWFLHGLYA